MMEEKDIFKMALNEVKKKKDGNEIKKEIEENYKIGIEYYEDVEKRQD